jgi:CRISPR-associated endonuclease/helicase Cas3
MTGSDFAEFYRAVHGRPPFPWQQRLAERVLASGWPERIAVPTGCGKTCSIDVAVFALAAQAGRPAGERTAPLRIFFIVDRRLVVDDVFRHAQDLAAKLAGGGAAITPVADALRKFGGYRPLEVAALRGGMYRANTWADAPSQPLVCVSTVDQVGSRLLFRGYGVSEFQQPVHAGLVANDSLLIVDEAHLSRPFLDTLGAVRDYQGEAWREVLPAPGLQYVQMSATVRDPGAAFQLGEDDRQSPALAPRLNVRKPAELKEVVNLPREAAEEAVRLADAGAGVVGVVLNTVAAARAAFRLLCPDPEANAGVLLTGRVRPYDRDALLDKFLGRIRAGRARTAGERLFVVATQTVEVGADLDFDALVTEAAPLDSLRQRFGRLNRLGQRESSPAAILRAKKSKETDWIYGEAACNTWKWLNEQADGGAIDFGVAAMTERIQSQGREGLVMEAGEGPLLFPAHLDAWAQTSPSPPAVPDVAPFLHGAGALDAADVQIVWRADLEGQDVHDWIPILEAAPPLSAEALSVPIAAAVRWLGRSTAAVADQEGVAEPAEMPAAWRPFLIWRGPGEPATRIRPGDTIVVRTSEGGCDRFGWDPSSETRVPDIGDPCASRRTQQRGGRFRMRLHPEVLFPGDSLQQRELTALFQRMVDEDSGATELEQFVQAAVSGDPDLTEAASALEWGRLKSYPTRPAAFLGESRWRRRKPDRWNLLEPDETDENDSSSRTVQVSLTDHTSGVTAKAREFIDHCGLTGPAASAVILAAELHDAGKWDSRFQLMLGNAYPEPLAKSPLHRKDEYPRGARHEFASVALAEACADWPEDCDRELTLYLIGTHHGRGRPFPPVWADGAYEISGCIREQAVTVSNVQTVASLDSGWTDRYWAVTRKYGWWGLAYLEAILRRADCVCSREEEEKCE